MTNPENIRNKSWMCRLKKTEAFIKKHNRSPSYKSKKEIYYAKFLCRLKSDLKYGILRPAKADIVKAFLEKYKQHFSPKEKYIYRLQSLSLFIGKHRKLPNQLVQEENNDYQFLYRQISKFRCNKLPEERAEIFKAFLHKFQHHFK